MTHWNLLHVCKSIKDLKLESVTCLLRCDHLMNVKKKEALHSPCTAGVVTVAACDPCSG